MRLLIALALVLFVSACTIPETSAQDYQQNLVNTCAGYGFQQGTPEFANCMMQMDQANRQRSMQLIQQQFQNMNRPIQGYQVQPVPPVPGQIHCYNWGGGYTNCTTQ